VIRTVIDTSVLIRYLIKPSAAVRELVELRWLGDEVQVVTAPELIRELEEVLARDYIQALVQPEEGQVLLDAIHRKAEILPALGTAPVYTRDRKDDKFIACALAGDARYIITLDKDILALRALGDVRMVTPEEFIALFQDVS
jgi:putative PIN family toxin of toxin-antitoxin system